MDLGAGLLAILTGVIVKGAVMAFAAWLLVRVFGVTYAPAPRKLWLLVPEESRAEARILWWSLLFFAISEATCGIEVYVLLRSWDVTSVAHAASSAIGMGLFALGLYRLLDAKVLRFGQQGCSVRRLCRTCTVAEPAGCKFRGVALLITAFIAAACVLPLFASTDRMVADLSKYTLPFPSLNAAYDRSVVPFLQAHVPGYQPSGLAYSIPFSELFVEFRVTPLAALVVAVAGLRRLARGDLVGGVQRAAFAAGMLAYAYLEMALYRGTGDVLIGSLGHEIAELWFLLVTAELLRKSFPVTGKA